MYAVGAYSGRLRDLIQLFKYSNMPSLAKPLGEFLRTGYPRGIQFDALVPMPIHPSRLRERGYNQAELLARSLEPITNLSIERLVDRTKKTEKQAGLTPRQRRLNVQNAFHVPDALLVRGKRVLLVDDVLTTGASANACALALKQAGASSVALLALARADRRIGAGPEAAMVLSQFV